MVLTQKESFYWKTSHSQGPFRKRLQEKFMEFQLKYYRQVYRQPSIRLRDCLQKNGLHLDDIIFHCKFNIVI